MRVGALRKLLHPAPRRAMSSSAQKLDPVQEALLQEQCILVDENDRALGQASKRECHTLDAATGLSPLHRAFSLFVFNERNELLMQQRSDAKITFPGLWTNTCCSHPLAVPEEQVESGGFGVKTAAQRRILNELGVVPEECRVEDMTYLTRILYASPSGAGDQWGEHELDYILFLRSTAGSMKVSPNPNEVKDIEYVPRAELADFLAEKKKSGVGITPWFELIAGSMLPVWWDNLDRLADYQDHENIKRFM